MENQKFLINELAQWTYTLEAPNSRDKVREKKYKVAVEANTNKNEVISAWLVRCSKALQKNIDQNCLKVAEEEFRKMEEEFKKSEVAQKLEWKVAFASVNLRFEQNREFVGTRALDYAYGEASPNIKWRVEGNWDKEFGFSKPKKKAERKIEEPKAPEAPEEKAEEAKKPEKIEEPKELNEEGYERGCEGFYKNPKRPEAAEASKIEIFNWDKKFIESLKAPEKVEAPKAEEAKEPEAPKIKAAAPEIKAKEPKAPEAPKAPEKIKEPEDKGAKKPETPKTSKTPKELRAEAKKLREKARALEAEARRLEEEEKRKRKVKELRAKMKKAEEEAAAAREKEEKARRERKEAEKKARKIAEALKALEGAGEPENSEEPKEEGGEEPKAPETPESPQSAGAPEEPKGSEAKAEKTKELEARVKSLRKIVEAAKAPEEVEAPKAPEKKAKKTKEPKSLSNEPAAPGALLKKRDLYGMFETGWTLESVRKYLIPRKEANEIDLAAYEAYIKAREGGEGSEGTENSEGGEGTQNSGSSEGGEGQSAKAFESLMESRRVKGLSPSALISFKAISQIESVEELMSHETLKALREKSPRTNFESQLFYSFLRKKKALEDSAYDRKIARAEMECLKQNIEFEQEHFYYDGLSEDKKRAARKERKLLEWAEWKERRNYERLVASLTKNHQIAGEDCQIKPKEEREMARRAERIENLEEESRGEVFGTYEANENSEVFMEFENEESEEEWAEGFRSLEEEGIIWGKDKEEVERLWSIIGEAYAEYWDFA